MSENKNKEMFINFDEYIRQYLRSQGFSVNNDMFERHSWYFRNALVRANYRNLEKGYALGGCSDV